METPAALLVLIASIAIAITGAAVFSKRHRAKWREQIQHDDSAYRASVEERVGTPLRVRIAIGMSFLMAALCAFRVAASVDDIMNLADGPHIRMALVPRGMHATILAAILMLTAAGSIPRLIQSGRDLARRVESVAPSRAQLLLVLSVVVASVQLFAITRVPIVIYWQRRMVLYLVVHIALAAITTIALRLAKPR
jgi:hypothetical protein